MNNTLNNNSDSVHIPVLLKEVTEFLNVRKGMIYVDCTLGVGGHSLEILKLLDGDGILIGIEQDTCAYKIAKERLKDFKNCYLFNTNFLDLKTILKSLNIEKITGGVLLDLGVSSLQLDDPLRGFSFKKSGPLDMRMNQKQELSAFTVVNTYSEKDLADLIYKFGEERYSRKIARFIVNNRPINNTLKLAELVCKCYPKLKYYNIHPATRTFQALRIEINKELEKLEKFLCFIPEPLSAKSRLTVISFHSLEDRIVKNYLKGSNEFKILTKKPVQSPVLEVKTNPRARSSKLRAAEKI